MEGWVRFVYAPQGDELGEDVKHLEMFIEEEGCWCYKQCKKAAQAVVREGLAEEKRKRGIW